jgi:hypothetical protein
MRRGGSKSMALITLELCDNVSELILGCRMGKEEYLL